MCTKKVNLHQEFTNIKISYKKEEIKFFVNKKKRSVTCVLYYNIISPVCALNNRIFRASVKTTCHKSDTFDINRGKRIALSKAENKAYKDTLNQLDETLRVAFGLIDCIKNFTFKADLQTEHNNNYILGLSDPNNEKYKNKLIDISFGKTFFQN